MSTETELREEIANLRAALERKRIELYHHGAPIFSSVECEALRAALDFDSEEAAALPEITDEQRDRVRAMIQARLKERQGKSFPPREPTLVEIAERRLAKAQERNSEVMMKLGDLAREANIPFDEIESLGAYEIVRKIRGERVSAWSWDSDLRSKCDSMRDGLGVEQLGPMYDSDNHEFHVVAIGGDTTTQRVLDVCARSWAPSPSASVLLAWKAYQEK